MSSISELPRQSETLSRPHATSRAPRTHARGPSPTTGPSARLAGRFRGDLATEQWWWSPELYALQGIPADSVKPSVGLLLAHVDNADRPGLREALSAAATGATAFAREYRVL